MLSSESFISKSNSFKQNLINNTIELALDNLPIESDEEIQEKESVKPDTQDEDYDSKRVELIKNLKEITLRKKLVEIQNRFISRKLINYFRKKKVNRALIDAHKSEMPELETRYESALQDFTKVCTNEVRTKQEMQKIETHALNLQQQQDSFERNVTEYENALLEVGGNLISAKTGELLSEKFIQSVLARQKKARDQLCMQRFEFIVAEKHSRDTQEKLKKLDDLGDGLCMADFEQLRTELQYLSDKIEERNNDLNRLRVKCDADTQKLANIREKRSVVLRAIDELSRNNEELSIEQHRLRDELNHLRVQYGELKKKIDKMSHESGLLNRLPLLHDYDNTLEKVQILHIENKALEAKIKILHKQI